MVIGAGSWGTALAMHLARYHERVFLWGRNPDHIEQMKSARENARYLPDIRFPSNLQPTNDISRAHVCTHILFVVPSHAFSETVRKVTPYIAHRPAITWAIKGFEDAALLSEQFKTCLPDRNYSILAGPSFAKEVAKNLPTAVTIAGSNETVVMQTLEKFHHDNFRVYASTDVIGVQLGGAIKNVIGVAAGIADGLGFGSNAIAALITRGLYEITTLGIAAGARRETFMGLSGLGDLVLTCTDNQSRNRRFGQLLGQGKSVKEAQTIIGQTIESIETLKQVPQYAEQFDVDMPITQATAAIVLGDLSPNEGVSLLLQRSAKSEQ